MISVTIHEQSILEKLKSLTPQQQQEVIDFIDFLEFKAHQSEEKKTEEQDPVSFLEAAQEFVGCVEGGPGDLATNKDYLQKIGHQ